MELYLSKVMALIATLGKLINLEAKEFINTFAAE